MDHHKTVLTLIFPTFQTALLWRKMIEERNVNFHSDTFIKNVNNDINEGMGGYYCDMKNSNNNIDSDNLKSDGDINKNDDNNEKNKNNNNFQNNNDSNNKKENNTDINNIIKEKIVRNKNEREIRCYNRLLVVPTSGVKSSQTENLKIEIAKSISSSRLT